MLNYISSGLCRVLDGEKARVPGNVSPFAAGRYLSKDSKVFECSRIAAKFELEAAKKSVMACFDKLLYESANHLDSCPNSRQYMKSSVADFVVRLLSEPAAVG